MCCWGILILKSYPNHSWVATSLDCVSQQSTFHTVNYLLLHPWHEIIVSNIAALKDHDTSVPSFQYPLEWNNWTPKHIKVNIQNSCTNTILFSSWYPKFQQDVAPKIQSQFPHGKPKKLNILNTQKLFRNLNLVILVPWWLVSTFAYPYISLETSSKFLKLITNGPCTATPRLSKSYWKLSKNLNLVISVPRWLISTYGSSQVSLKFPLFFSNYLQSILITFPKAFKVILEIVILVPRWLISTFGYS